MNTIYKTKGFIKIHPSHYSPTTLENWKLTVTMCKTNITKRSISLGNLSAFWIQSKWQNSTFSTLKWLTNAEALTAPNCLFIVKMIKHVQMSTYLRNEVEAGEEGTCASSYWSKRERAAVTQAERDIPLTPPLGEWVPIKAIVQCMSPSCSVPQ